MTFTPEALGFSSAKLEKILRELDEFSVPMHSLLIARGDSIALDAYWAPFTKDTLHRMNSVTKSFVGLAVGCLIDEGKMSLSDRVADYFPEIPKSDIKGIQGELTVEDLLTMRTGYRPVGNGHWVRDREYDRIRRFFERVSPQKQGDSFYYDSAGSYILGVIVERLTGGSFMKYLQRKFLDDIGFSRDTDCILGGEGYSWSDSGLLCTTHDLYKTAKFINAGGVHAGVRYISEKFMRDAVSAKASTAHNPVHKSYGYGYQIWKAKYDGFMFLGMGAQIMICIPSRDLYIVCTADTQPCDDWRIKMFEKFYEIIDSDVECGADRLPEDPSAYASLCQYVAGLKLSALKGGGMPEKYCGVSTKTYVLDENPMGISEFSLSFEKTRGVFRYVNEQGEKEIPFGIGYNEFSEFPEDGYFDMEIGVGPKGHRYPIATSAAWQGEDKLVINVQFIGRHLGGDTVEIMLSDGAAHLSMKKSTNCFLDRYSGEANGK